jgi:hypothetical protein
VVDILEGRNVDLNPVQDDDMTAIKEKILSRKSRKKYSADNTDRLIR